jgi:hypothetical protein
MGGAGTDLRRTLRVLGRTPLVISKVMVRIRIR